MLAGPDSIALGRREWLTSIPQIPSAAADQLDSSDLISFLKAIPDGRSPRCALPTVVPVVGGGARDSEWQQELP